MAEAKQCLLKAVRDFLFYVRYAHFVSQSIEPRVECMSHVMQDGKYIQTAMSVEHPLCPPIPGVIRAQVRGTISNYCNCPCHSDEGWQWVASGALQREQ